jgi:hypothetical protein
VEVFPKQMEVGKALAATTGNGFTVTTAVAVF